MDAVLYAMLKNKITETTYDDTEIRQELLKVAENATDMNSSIAQNTNNIEKKLDKNQGASNSGKITGINESGDIVPMFPQGVTYNEDTQCLEYGADEKLNLNAGIQLDDTLSKVGYAADAASVGELKSDLAEMSSNKKYNELDCTIEGVLSVNGTDLQSSKYMRTDYIDVSGYEEYKYIGNVENGVCFLSQYTEDRIAIPNTIKVSNSDNKITVSDRIYPTAKYLRFDTLKDTDAILYIIKNQNKETTVISENSVSDSGYIDILGNVVADSTGRYFHKTFPVNMSCSISYELIGHTAIRSISFLSKNGAVVDSVVSETNNGTVKGTYFADNSIAFISVTVDKKNNNHCNQFVEIKYNNYDSTTELVSGFRNSVDEIEKYTINDVTEHGFANIYGGITADDSRYYYKYVPIRGCAKVSYKLVGHTLIRSISTINKYGNADSFVIADENTKMIEGTFYTSVGCKYILFTVDKVASAKNEQFVSIKYDDEKTVIGLYNYDNSDYSYVINSYENILCIGDSLTEGITGEVKDGQYVITNRNYPYFMEKKLGGTSFVTNAGASGRGAKDYWEVKIPTLDFDSKKYNLAIINLGTNYGLTDTIETDVNQYSDYNDYANTQTGCYCKIIEYLKEKNPDITVLLCTVPHNSANDGYTIRQEVIRKISRKYNLPIVDLWNKSVMGTQKGNVYRPNDNLHYNELGYATLASEILKLGGKAIFEKLVN